MLNNNDLISVANAFNKFHGENISFNLKREAIGSKKENDSFLPAQLDEIKQEYAKRKVELEKLKNEIKSLEQFIRPDIFNGLMNALGNEMASLDMLVSDCDNFINTNDSKYIDSVMYGFELEKEQSHILMNSVTSFQMNLGMNLLPKVLNGEIESKDLEMMITNFDPNSEIYKNIMFVINAVNNQNKRKIEDEESVIQNQTEDMQQEKYEKDDIISTSTNDFQNETLIKHAEEYQQRQETTSNEPTLYDKISNIKYENRGNINREVKALTVEERLLQIAIQIKELESKEKLNMRDTIKLHNLKSQELNFQEYMKRENDKLSLSERMRENSLDKGTSKIGEKEASLNKSKELHEQYASKTMRFLSARYQEGLTIQIESLKQKNGLLAEKQKASSIARFNKQSKKIAFKSSVIGLVNGVKDTVARKIDELKQLKAEVIAEIGNIKQDIGRFTSAKEQLPLLQEATVVVPDNIISFEEVKRIRNEKNQMVA